MLPVSVRAEGEGSFDAVGGKVTYRMDGDSITITGCEDTVKAIEFPDAIEGMPVKTIEDRAFLGKTSLTSVAFPENLTSLGEEVFYQCGSLENVDFSSCTSLTEIKWGSFCETGLTSLTLPDSVVTIQYQAFAECSQLTSLNLGDGVQFIGANAFWGAGITSLTLPDSLATLEDFAFAYCESLTSIEWPDNEDFTTVTGFGGCTALPVEEYNEAVSLSSVTALGTEAFSYCTFESVTIPSGIHTIGEGAFWGADSMKSLTIMPGVTYIESDAFANCSGLAGTTIVVPETVISIGGNAFGGCAKEQQMTDEEGFIYYAFTEVTVEIRNRDFSLSPKSDYYSYAPVTIDGTDYENPFGNATVIRAYETDSQGNRSMMYRLYEVLKDVEIYPDNTQHKQKAYRFEALTDAAVYTVSGSIPEGASVLLRRDGREIPVTVTGNRFSAEVTSGADVSVTVKLDGYYDKYFLPESGSVLNATGIWGISHWRKFRRIVR